MRRDSSFLHTGELGHCVTLTLASPWHDLPAGTVLSLQRSAAGLELCVPTTTAEWLRYAFCYTEEDADTITTREWGHVRLEGPLLRALPLIGEDGQPFSATVDEATTDAASVKTARLRLAEARTTGGDARRCATRWVLVARCPLSAPQPIVPLTHRAPRVTCYVAAAASSTPAVDLTLATAVADRTPADGGERTMVTSYLPAGVSTVTVRDYAEFQVDGLSTFPARYIFQPGSAAGTSILELREPVSGRAARAQVRSLVDAFNVIFGGNAHVGGQLDVDENGEVYAWRFSGLASSPSRTPWPLFRVTAPGWDECSASGATDDEETELPFHSPAVLDEAMLADVLTRWFDNPRGLNLRAIAALLQASDSGTVTSAVHALRGALHFAAGDDAHRFAALQAAMRAAGAHLEDSEAKVWAFGESCAQGELVADVTDARWRAQLVQYRTLVHRVIVARSGLATQYIDYATAFFLDQPLTSSPPYAW